MNLKIIRSRMDDLGPAPRGTVRETTTDVPLIHALLVAKMGEETAEYVDARTLDDKAMELADMLEVINALATLNGFTLKDLLQWKENMTNNRGGLVTPTSPRPGHPGYFTAELLRRP